MHKDSPFSSEQQDASLSENPRVVFVMDELNLAEIEAELARTEEYLRRSADGNVVYQAHAASLLSTKEAGGLASEASASSSHIRRRSSGRAELTEGRRREIIAQLAAERVQGSIGSRSEPGEQGEQEDDSLDIEADNQQQQQQQPEGEGVPSLYGDYETDEARKSLLDRLLSDYRSSHLYPPSTQNIATSGGQEEEPMALQSPRSLVEQGEEEEEHFRYEHLLLDSPERGGFCIDQGQGMDDGRDGAGGDTLYYASDLLNEMGHEDQQAPATMPPAKGEGYGGHWAAPRQESSSLEAIMPEKLRKKLDARHNERRLSGGAPCSRDRVTLPTDECTFRPQINDYEQLSLSVTQKQRIPFKEAIAHLARSQEQTYAEREKIRLEQEKEQMHECTFKPKLCKGTEKRVAAKGKRAATLPLAERMKQRSEEAELTRIITKHQVEQQEMRECTFKPKINPASKVVAKEKKTYKPIHQRLGDIQRAKRDHLSSLRESAELHNPNLTFQPKISSASDRIAKSLREQEAELQFHDAYAGEEGVVYPGLSVESQRFKEERARRHLELEQQQWRELRSVPKLSKGTERLAKEKEELQLGFLDRQNVLNEKVKRKAAEKQASYLEKEKEWFKPSIGKAEQVLFKRKPEYAKENIEQRVERLSIQEHERIRRDREKRTEEYYSRYTYEPDINKVSRLLARPSTTEELVSNWRGEMARVRAVQEAEERHHTACTFNPQLISRPWTRNSAAEAWHQQEQRLADLMAAYDENDIEGARGRGEGFHHHHPHHYDGYTAAGGGIGGGGEGGSVALTLACPAREGGADYPPKPRLNLNLKDPQSIASEVARYRREKEEYARQARVEREIEELEKCTFQPLVNKKMPRTKTPVIVRGLGKYLENRDHAIRLQQDKEERKKQVFGAPSTVCRTPDGTTTVKPFRLSQGRNRRSKEAVKAEVEHVKSSECSFKPKTVESARREAIRRMLEEE